jgi:DNA-binding FadR family transcriptional regulator
MPSKPSSPAWSPLPQVGRTSLVDATIEVIRSHIESGAWKIGERIPKEAELADMLHVGRNTVREAVRVLSHAQLLEVRQGDGTYVRSNVDPTEIMRRVSRSSAHDHLELRMILESEASRLAAVRRTEADLAELRRLLDARGHVDGPDDLESFVDRDLAFHFAVMTSAHNTALEELYRYFSATVRFSTLAILTDQKLPEPGLAAHVRLLEAIERQDPDAATDATRAMFASVIEALNEHLAR